MAAKRVYLKAYLNSNFGDDMFVKIVSERYPDTDFFLLKSDKDLKGLGSNIHGAYSALDRVIFKCSNILDKRLNSMRGKKHEIAVEKKLIDTSDARLYVIGSGFMEMNYGSLNEARDRYYYASKPYLIGCNFGPYKTEHYLELHKEFFAQCSDLCFRDSASHELFSELTVARHETDVVFTYTGKANRVVPEAVGKYIVISPVNLKKCKDELVSYEDEYIEYLTACAKKRMAEGYSIVLAGFCRAQGDDAVIKRISDNIPGAYVYNYPDVSIEDIAGIFKYADEAIVSRYHGAVMSLLYGIRVNILSYSAKTDNAMHDIDHDMYVCPISSMSDITVEDFLSKGYSISNEKLVEIKKSAERQFEKIDGLLN